MIKLDEQSFTHDHIYKSDCRRIQKAMIEEGALISLDEAYKLWEAYSDSMAAGWVGLPDDDEEISLRVNLDVLK